MVINRVLCIEDSTEKYMDINRFLRSQNIDDIGWVTNAEKAFETIAMNNYDLIVSDMHFDYFGVDDRNAGEKLLHLLRENGNLTPFIFCSSQNWKIEGSLGNIFYNPRRNWELEAEKLIKELRRDSIS